MLIKVCSHRYPTTILVAHLKLNSRILWTPSKSEISNIPNKDGSKFNVQSEMTREKLELTLANMQINEFPSWICSASREGKVENLCQIYFVFLRCQGYSFFLMVNILVFVFWLLLVWDFPDKISRSVIKSDFLFLYLFFFKLFKILPSWCTFSREAV